MVKQCDGPFDGPYVTFSPPAPVVEGVKSVLYVCQSHKQLELIHNIELNERSLRQGEPGMPQYIYENVTYGPLYSWHNICSLEGMNDYLHKPSDYRQTNRRAGEQTNGCY